MVSERERKSNMSGKWLYTELVSQVSPEDQEQQCLSKEAREVHVFAELLSFHYSNTLFLIAAV